MGVSSSSCSQNSAQVRTQRKVLVAAIKLLHETQNYVDLRTIAGRAGVSESVVRYHFRTSDGVIAHALATVIDELNIGWSPSRIASTGPEEALQHTIDQLLAPDGQSLIVAAHLGYLDKTGRAFREVLVLTIKSFLEHFKGDKIVWGNRPLTIIAEHHVNGMIGSVVGGRNPSEDYAWFLHDQLLKSIRVR